MSVSVRSLRNVGFAVVGSIVVAGLAIGAPVDLKDKGVGPIKQVKLGPIDPALAKQGEAVFMQKCSACHKLDERYVGPAQRGVTKRRSPEWIMNMTLNPTGMTAEDPIAQQLLGEYMVQMTFQNVSEADARAVLEFFRQSDAAAPAAAGAAPAAAAPAGAAPGGAAKPAK